MEIGACLDVDEVLFSSVYYSSQADATLGVGCERSLAANVGRSSERTEVPMNRIRTGTSGWSYRHWEGAFYPPSLADSQHLPYYAERFPTVEVNASFYRMPTEQAVRHWAERVGDDFVFAVKGSRFITHYHRLENVAGQVAAFLSRMQTLGDKLGVVLWQLPASMSPHHGELDAFLGLMPRTGLRHAVEFRDKAWLTDETYEILRGHNAAVVNVSSAQMPQDLTVTADFVYVRFHGLPDFDHDYTAEQLRPWAEFLKQQDAEGRDGYVYFNNDGRARAPANASELIRLLGPAAYPEPTVSLVGRDKEKSHAF